MINDMVQTVILCGGAGSRLWPLSRQGFPKQFLCLNGSESLFQQTVGRMRNIFSKAPYILCNKEHKFLVKEQLRELSVEAESVFLESSSKNTAPALTLAALAAIDKGYDPVLVVTPADQAINDIDSFNDAVLRAVELAAVGGVVVLGVRACRPETGYGYIKVVNQDGLLADVECFVEKPEAMVAERYVLDGGYFWNSGMFVLKASVWLEAIKRFRQDIFEDVWAVWGARVENEGVVEFSDDLYSRCSSESIDYAVIEKCPGSGIPIKMVVLEAGWNDLGAWDSVWDVGQKNSNGNVLSGDVRLVSSSNCLVKAESRLVTLVGVEGLVVVETADAVLIANKNSCQDVKKLVSELGLEGRAELEQHRKVNRPWGWYDSIEEAGRFKVKRIMVSPGASLSLQKHYHRAEHWIVVSGTAEVTRGDVVSILGENQSTYIPLGEVHRLSNPGCIPLEIIEVQSGGYLGEDDIVRIEDVYGRED